MYHTPLCEKLQSKAAVTRIKAQLPPQTLWFVGAVPFLCFLLSRLNKKLSSLYFKLVASVIRADFDSVGDGSFECA